MPYCYLSDWIFRSVERSSIAHCVCPSVSPSVRLSLTVRFFLHISYITRYGKFLEVPTPNMMCGHMILEGYRQYIDKT